MKKTTAKKKKTTALEVALEKALAKVAELTLEVEEFRRSVSVEIPDAAWREVDEDDRSLLVASITISGTFFHLDAFEVEEGDDQELVNDEREERFSSWLMAASPDGQFETVTIKGRHYVVFASPYC